MNETRYCWQCQEPFVASREDHHFCSPKCVAAYYRDHDNPEYTHAYKMHNHPYECEECGNAFFVNDYARRGGQREPKFCSAACKQKNYRKRSKFAQQQAERRYSGSSQQNRSERTREQQSGYSEQRQRARGSTSGVGSRAEALILLGLAEGFTQDALKKRYRQMMRTWHPDVNKSPEATRMAQAINAAYDRLKL